MRSGRGVFTRRALVVMAAQAGVLGALGRRLYNIQPVEGDQDRKSGGAGKSVDLGGRRVIKKKNES